MKTTVPPPDLQQVAEVVATLRMRGLWIERSGSDQIKVGPPERVDPETVDLLLRLKPLLLDLLAQPRSWPCVRCGRHRFHLPRVCYWCARLGESPADA